MTSDSWDNHIIPNLYSPLILSKEFVKRLSHNKSGNIINIIDQRVLNLTPHFLVILFLNQVYGPQQSL